MGLGHQYRRDVGTAGAALLVVNGLIGSGIFALPELLHQAVGTFAPWLLLAGAVLIGSVFFCFAELARLTDRSGGPQRYVTDAFGRFPGFQVGWLFYFGRMVAHAANVTVLVAYVAALWPAAGEGPLHWSLIILVIAAVTLVNVVGIKRAISALGTLTLFKLVPLVLLIVLALSANPPVGQVALPQFSAIEGVALAALYAFVGVENATIPAGEMSDPKKALPRALPVSLAIVTMIFRPAIRLFQFPGCRYRIKGSPRRPRRILFRQYRIAPDRGDRDRIGAGQLARRSHDGKPDDRLPFRRRAHSPVVRASFKMGDAREFDRLLRRGGAGICPDRHVRDPRGQRYPRPAPRLHGIDRRASAAAPTGRASSHHAPDRARGLHRTAPMRLGLLSIDCQAMDADRSIRLRRHVSFLRCPLFPQSRGTRLSTLPPSTPREFGSSP